MQIASPLPGYCSSCFNADQTNRYIDFEAAFDGAPVLNAETLTIEVLPWNGEQSSHDDLYLCEACVRKAAELLAYKPELHARQLAENKQTAAERDEWRETAKRLQAELDRQMRTLFESTEPKRKKVAA